jgi:hypothetical protein
MYANDEAIACTGQPVGASAYRQRVECAAAHVVVMHGGFIRAHVARQHHSQPLRLAQTAPQRLGISLFLGESSCGFVGKGKTRRVND